MSTGLKVAEAALRLGDVRRLTGPNFLIEGIGAAGEAAAPDDLLGPAVALWRAEARALLDGVGWPEARIAVRPYPGGASLMHGYSASYTMHWAMREALSMWEPAQVPTNLLIVTSSPSNCQTR